MSVTRHPHLLAGVCGLAVTLTLAPAATAAAPPPVAPVILSVVSWIAGHPVTVACDVDTNPSPFPSPGYTATAWTYTGGNVIHVMPAFCDYSTAPVGSDNFARVIDVFIHEAARARGVQTDTCVEMTSDVGVYDVLRRFYGIPFFSRMSVLVGAQVLALTRTLPASFQPEACWASGTWR